MSKIGLDAVTQAPPPLLVPEQGRGTIGWQSHRSPMPLSNFMQSHRSPMPLWKKCLPSPASRAVVLDAGPLLEPPVPPLVRLRAALGSCCGASVGTTGSAPRALACRRLRTKFHKICCRSCQQQNFTKFVANPQNLVFETSEFRKKTGANPQNYKILWTRACENAKKTERKNNKIPQNSTKFCGPGHAKTRRKVNAKTTKFHKIDKN